MPNDDVDMDRSGLNTSAAQIVHLVGADQHVLAVGGLAPDLERDLRQAGCTVTEAAPTDLPADSFDVILLSDGLQHLTDAGGVLADAAKLSAPGGRVILSVQNATHGSIRLAQLQGRRTDTRPVAFSRRGLLDLLESAGLQANELRAVVHDPLDSDVEIDQDDLPPGVVEWVRGRPDALVRQFVVSASAAEPGRDIVHTARVITAVNPDEVRLQDRHTDAAVDAARESLRTKDHILGLQAETTLARGRVKRANARNARLQERLDRQGDVVARQKRRITELERQGFVGFLRRVKRKMSN